MADDPVPIPAFVSAWLAGRPVRSVTAASPSSYDPRPWTISLDEPCAAAATAISASATAAGFTAVASGTEADSSWLALSNGHGLGADLTLFADPTAPASTDATATTTASATCEVAGVPLTPVHVHLDGPVTADVQGFAGVECSAGPNGGVLVEIWGMPLGAPDAIGGLIVETSDGPQPGPHTLGTVKADTGILETAAAVWSFDQLVATAYDGKELPPGAVQLTAGTVVLGAGLDGGTLDLTGGDQHLAVTFACGTPPVPAT